MTNTAVTSNNTLRKLAGAAFFAAPVLMIGGMLTSPPQDSNSARDYLASLARTGTCPSCRPTCSTTPGCCWRVAVPAALALLRGARGRTLASIGVVGTVLGAVQMSGLLFSDWTSAAMPSVVSLDEAVTVFDKVNSDPSMAAWLLSAKARDPDARGADGGLARNGIVGWWTAPMARTPMIVGRWWAGCRGAWCRWRCTRHCSWSGTGWCGGRARTWSRPRLLWSAGPHDLLVCGLLLRGATATSVTVVDEPRLGQVAGLP